MADTDAKSLSELMELTGLDIVAARSLLHAFNGDTNAAMNDFLENGVGSKPSEFMETDSPDHAQAHAQTSTVEHSDTDDEDPRRDTHTQTTTRTTTTASSSGDGRVYETAPQQEAKQSSSHVGGSGSSDEEFDTTHIGRRIRTRKRSYNPAENDGVRAPDQQYRERLLDPHAMRFEQGPVRKRGPLAFIHSNVEITSEEELRRRARLIALFSQPSICFLGTFAGSKEYAAAQGRWLIVNIQRQDVFHSHTLNRDCWKDTRVHHVITESYLLWQKNDDSPEAEKYEALYPVKQYPYVAVLDPHTGEKVAELFVGVAVSADMFLSASERFLDENILPNERTKRDRTKKTKPVMDLSEEAQIAAAIAASLAEVAEDTSSKPTDKPKSRLKIVNSDSDSDPDSESESDPDADVVASDKENERSPLASPKAAHTITSTAPPTPPSTTEATLVTRIVFKLPDGSRQNRKFLKQNKVADLYAYAAQVTNLRPAAFKLVMHTTPLDTMRNSTLEEAKALNTILIIEPL